METSRLAVASLRCAVGAIISMFLSCLLTFSRAHVAAGLLVGVSLLLAVVTFVISIAAIIVITCGRDKLKGFWRIILALFLVIPLNLVLGSSLYVARVRAERRKTNTGLYNLRLLGNTLTEYAKSNSGYLPNAEKWCDLLMEQNGNLTRANFKHPKSERRGLKEECHFAFNRNLSGMRLTDIHDNVVLIFEADGDWNLNGAAELLGTRSRKRPRR